MTQTSNKPKINVGLRAELKFSITPIKFELETVGGNHSLYQGTISSQESVKIRDFVHAFDKNIAQSIPNDITITINELLLILSKEQSRKKLLISLGLGTEINLSNLPLIGKKFSPEQTIAIKDFKLLYASHNFSKIEVEKILKLSEAEKERYIAQGISLSASMQFGEYEQTLDIAIFNQEKKTESTAQKERQSSGTQKLNSPQTLTITASEDSSNNQLTTQETTTDSPQTSDTTRWFEIKKNFGPVYFQRVGVQYQNSEIWFLLDASIFSAGLTLTLNGLSVGSSIKKFKPKFNLQGIDIEYESKGNLSIGGAFLRTTVNGKDEYSGAVLIETKTFTLSAIGSYTTTENGHPSLFIYGILNKPIGGLPFFFVTGLALGFAYNRSLILPTLDEIPQFPLVKAVINASQADTEGLIAIQRELNEYIPPKVGQVVLMVGVKFSSFKLIESFVLLVATFGNQFALDLIGISTLISPPILPGQDPNKLPPPLAQIRLGIRARFVPSKGTLKVEAKLLPDSYLFDRDCRISGGFAFYSWFSGDHAGDFVLTVGGYHPRFEVPAHYPRVDPLALNWRISNNLSVKGSLYFALTASAIMAGGRLEAFWESGNIKAWFIANANFIVAWQPYFYDAQIGVNLSASYTFNFFGYKKTITVEVGANLHIWGPEFSGTATIDISIVSFTIRFGSGSQKRPAPLNWSEFKTSFLPAQEEVCTVAVESGLLRKVEGEEIFIVNPKEFLISTSSVIPIKTFKTGTIKTSNTGEEENQKTFGIAPMNVNSGKFTQSEYTITIDKEPEQFTYEPIYKNIPTALWGESNSNDPNRTRFVNNVLSGFKIKPANPPQPGQTQSIERKNLAYDTEKVDNAYQWNSFSTFSKSEETNEDIRERNIGESITSEDVKNARESLLQSLGLSATNIDLAEFETDKGIEQAFIIAPQLEEAIV